MTRCVPLLLVLALVAAGCGGGSTSSPPPQTTAPRRAQPPDPGGVLLALLAAAKAGDADEARRLVTASTRRHVDVARLAATAQALAGAKVVLSERVDGPWAIAAVARGSRAFAAAVRLERGAWRIELGNGIRLRPVLPFPGRIALSADPQIAAEAKASSALIGIGLWLDGLDFSVEARGPRASYATAYGRSGRQLAPGLHVVVAFARAGMTATATAWTFKAFEAPLGA